MLPKQVIQDCTQELLCETPFVGYIIKAYFDEQEKSNMKNTERS